MLYIMIPHIHGASSRVLNSALKFDKSGVRTTPPSTFPGGRKYFSGDLDFLLQNYSKAAQRKWLASVAAAQAQKAHNTANVTRGEPTAMFTWLHGN
jgi:hypothetical protein